MKAKPPGALGRIAGVLKAGRGNAPSQWQPAGCAYPQLADVDMAATAGRAGLYLLWHLGVRPRWLRAGYALDLGGAAALLAKSPEVVALAAHGRLFFSWFFCAPECAPGHVTFLNQRLEPALRQLALACDAATDPAASALPCPLPAGTHGIDGKANA
jgi:hypothetical protein